MNYATPHHMMWRTPQLSTTNKQLLYPNPWQKGTTMTHVFLCVFRLIQSRQLP